MTVVARARLKETLGRWLPPLGWAALIFALSAQPNPYGLLPSQVPPAWYEPLGRALHAGEYAVLAFLLGRALAGGGELKNAALLAAFGLSLLYGVLDELHQRFVPGRAFQLVDLALDLVGILLGLGMRLAFRSHKKRV